MFFMWFISGGPVWPHSSYGCQVGFEDFDNEGIQATNHLCLRAAGDILHGVDEALWLRGLSELHVPDPFDLKYDFFNSRGNDRLDVTGCILGGDGSGGKFGK